MTKKQLYLRLWALLMLLMPVIATPAQAHQLEYWFDSYSNPIAFSFSGSSINRSLSVERLSDGFHQLYMRVKTTDGRYSPVTSSTFIKFTASGGSRLEYWFDDDISKLSTVPIDITLDEAQVIDLDNISYTKFPLGFHKLSMRVAANGNHYSPVYSDYVMRLPKGQPTEISYWLDDNYAGRRVVKGMGVNETTALLRTTLDFSSSPVGMHRLKYRITANGFDEGVIYEMPILLTEKYNSVDDATIVGESYWLDDVSPLWHDVANPQKVYTKSYILDPEHYTVGQHAFHVQYRNSADVWSQENVTYFYKEESGMLRVGTQPASIDDLEFSSLEEEFNCIYRSGTIFVDCISPELAATGIVQVYDITGKLIASQVVTNQDGIHAEINVEGYSKQLLIVRMQSGSVLFNKKIMVF